jgi:glutamate-1-semialdehyde 2,1-aminomutase
MAAGLACLNALQADNFYQTLSNKTAMIVEGLKIAAAENNVDMSFSQIGGMFGFFFTKEDTVSLFKHVTNCDMSQFKQFYHGMLDEGIYLAPSAYETGFMSMAHEQHHIDATIDAAQKVLATL